MTAHNYDGDILTDEISQIHRSPGFITSNLVGKADDGNTIRGLLLFILNLSIYITFFVVVCTNFM